jgi:hypothetical protein
VSIIICSLLFCFKYKRAISEPAYILDDKVVEITLVKRNTDVSNNPNYNTK